jgi:hypothetical protein
MAVPTLLRLAQDLEWLGCELEHYGKKHAHEGFPESGPTWIEFLMKQKGVIATADKIERELKGAIHFNPASLVGVEFPLEAAFDSIVTLLGAVEDIKASAVLAVHLLPAKVRSFTKMVETYLEAVGAVHA